MILPRDKDYDLGTMEAIRSEKRSPQGGHSRGGDR